MHVDVKKFDGGKCATLDQALDSLFDCCTLCWSFRSFILYRQSHIVDSKYFKAEVGKNVSLFCSGQQEADIRHDTWPLTVPAELKAKDAMPIPKPHYFAQLAHYYSSCITRYKVR